MKNRESLGEREKGNVERSTSLKQIKHCLNAQGTAKELHASNKRLKFSVIEDD